MGFIATLKIFYHYAKPYRSRYVLGIVALFAVDLLNVLPPLVLKSFIDQVTKTFGGAPDAQKYAPYLWMGLAYSAIAIGQGVCRYLWRMLLIQSSHRAAERIRADYFEKLQKLPPSFYDRHSIGNLISLASNDVDAVRFALGPGFLVTTDALFLFLVLPPAMLWLSPKLTLVSLAPLLLLPFLITRLQKLIHHRFEQVQAQFARLSSFAQENLEGIRIIKAFTREWTQLRRFSNIGKEFIRLNLKLTKTQSLFEPLFMLAVALGLVALTLFAGPDVIAGKISIGTFVAFIGYLEQMVWPMVAFGLGITHYQRGKSSMSRISAILDEKEERELATSEPSVNNDPSTSLLEVRGLSFSYPEKPKLALKNISFKLEAGTKAAVVGPIGGGKSTLVRLLAGLYDIPAGTVFWNGTDMNTLALTQRRTEIAVVPQEAFLFSETLGWNVEFGASIKPDSARVLTTLKNAGLEKELKQWDLTLQVGEKGANLSGGQRARVALARALIREARLLILDDALSSVDAETESMILDTIEKKNPDQALLMVTHRFTRLSNFDQVLVLRDGELVQVGAPKALAKEKGLYRQLFELQRMESALEKSYER